MLGCHTWTGCLVSAMFAHCYSGFTSSWAKLMAAWLRFNNYTHRWWPGIAAGALGVGGDEAVLVSSFLFCPVTLSCPPLSPIVICYTFASISLALCAWLIFYPLDSYCVYHHDWQDNWWEHSTFMYNFLTCSEDTVVSTRVVAYEQIKSVHRKTVIVMISKLTSKNYLII